MTVFVFGNEDVEEDSLPIKILPRLQDRFHDVEFVVKDPNEEWEVPDELIVIDTVFGIESVHVFHDLDEFAETPRVTMHGFDALMNLQLLQKLGKLGKIKIIGVSPTISKEEAVGLVGDELNMLTKK